jgi:hypothetical protein
LDDTGERPLAGARRLQHLLDTTETYFVGFDAAQGDGRRLRRYL